MKKILFCFLLFFATNLFSQDILSKTPRLVWKKEFNTRINFIAISSDGRRIAVTVDTIDEKIKDDRYYKGVRYYSYGSKLYYLDGGGNVLWSYECGPMCALREVEMSDDGKYIVCSLLEYETEDREVGKMQVGYYKEVLFFNSEGRLLWTFKASCAEIRVSSDGNYVLLIPSSDEGEVLDNFYFLDKTGKKLWEVKPNRDPWLNKGFMSKDGKYIAIGNRLYDNNKNVLLDLNEFLRGHESVFFENLNKDCSIGIAEAIGPGSSYGIDLKNKKVLWKKDEAIYDIVDDKYIINKNVYDLISGEFISTAKWGYYSRWIRIDDKYYVIKEHGDGMYFYELLTGKSQKVLEIPELQNWGIIRISENNKNILIRVKNNLYLYEIK
jgi:hypothetical protein